MDLFTPHEFDRMLARHDWFYDYSDDHSVWRHGSDQRQLLRAIAKQSTIHNMLFDMWHEYHYADGTWEDKRVTLNEKRAIVLPAPITAET